MNVPSSTCMFLSLCKSRKRLIKVPYEKSSSGSWSLLEPAVRVYPEFQISETCQRRVPRALRGGAFLECRCCACGRTGVDQSLRSSPSPASLLIKLSTIAKNERRNKIYSFPETSQSSGNPTYSILLRTILSCLDSLFLCFNGRRAPRDFLLSYSPLLPFARETIHGDNSLLAPLRVNIVPIIVLREYHNGSNRPRAILASVGIVVIVVGVVN